MILSCNITKLQMKNIVSELCLKEIENNIDDKSEIVTYKMGVNIIFFYYGKMFIKNNIIDKVLKEKGTIYYNFDIQLKIFFKKKFNLNLEKDIFKISNQIKEKCLINNCNYSNLNNNYCKKHIILDSLKEYIFYKIINNINYEIPYFIRC